MTALLSVMIGPTWCSVNGWGLDGSSHVCRRISSREHELGSMIIINLWRRLTCFVVRYEITEKIASKPPYCNHRNDYLTLHIENWLFFPTDRFQGGIQNCTNVPRRKTKRAIRMIRLDNRDQTGESGCKTGIEWLSGHKNHKKSLKYRLLNTDYKVFTNITDLVTYHFTNSHVTIVTWITWHHIILHHFCFIWKFSILDMF